MATALSMDQALIEKLNNILKVNLDKEHFGVKELAREAGLSRSQLNRKLQSILEKSTSRFIREYRLEEAKKMLQNNEATASEIAYRVGFNSPTYFNTCFNEFYGYPPGEAKFRKNGTIPENKPEEFPVKLGRRIKRIRIFNRRLVWINTIAILLLSVLSYSLYQKYLKPQANNMVISDDQQKSIAILPFKNLSEDLENQYFADGVSGTIESNLNKISDFKIISSLSMEKYRNTDMAASEIADETNVNYLLSGSVLKHGDSVRVLTNLVNARQNELVLSSVFDWEYKNIFEIQRRIAKDIVNELEVNIAPNRLENLNTDQTPNLEAYNLCLKGRFFWNRFSPKNTKYLNLSLDYFKKAIELDSNYSKAYSGLADTYLRYPDYTNIKTRDSLFGFSDEIKFMNLAEEYSNKALALDPDNYEAMTTLGTLYYWRDLNWEASENEFLKAIKLNPNYATAHFLYSELLHYLFRLDEARAEIQKAINLDPNSYLFLFQNMKIYVNEGHYEKAILEFNKMDELSEEIDQSIYSYLQICYFELGQEEKAFEVARKQNKKFFEIHADSTDMAFNNSGIKGICLYANRMLIREGCDKKRALLVANNYGFAGEVDKAMDYLEFIYENGNKSSLIEIKSFPAYVHFKKEPRFLALLEKLNMGEYDN